jgi:hypothetical protein
VGSTFPGFVSVVSVVCCQVEVSATNLSLSQKSPTDCGMLLCDTEASKMRRSWPATLQERKAILILVSLDRLRRDKIF